jgi:hypothetical protein
MSSVASVAAVAGREVLVVTSELVAVTVDGIDHEFMFRSEAAAEEFIEETVLSDGRECGMQHQRAFSTLDLTGLSSRVLREDAA